ncbi:hypothetical protein ACJQWK_09965 [Exserohilum turcicum]
MSDSTTQGECYKRGPVWPLAISGTEVTRLADVCEISVQTQPELLIWAFTRSARCETWRMQNHMDPRLCAKLATCKHGIVHDNLCADEDGHVFMTDARQTRPANDEVDVDFVGNSTGACLAPRRGIGGYDGSACGVLSKMPRALAVENDEWVDYVDVRGCVEAWYDGHGDVVMWHGF